MDSLDFWRFCEELTVVQAALLIVGEDPSSNAHYVDGWKPEDKPKGYVAVFSALQHSINAERLRAAKVYLPLHPDHPDTEHPLKSVDWQSTLIRVDHLKDWLQARGMQSGFFFPEGPLTAEYLDDTNESFAPKLAAAVEAWKAVRIERAEKPSARSVKQDLTKWLNLHAGDYGLANEEGEPNRQAIEDVSKVANWDTKGGAPKTPGN